MEREINTIVSALFQKYFGETASNIIPIENSGSSRKYFRIGGMKHNAIGVFSPNVAENATFIYFAQSFEKEGLAVPSVLIVSEDKQAYLTSDLGDAALLDYIDRLRPMSIFESETIAMYKQVLDGLLQFQLRGAKIIDFAQCFADQQFDRQLITRDLNYCRYYFLKILVPTLNEKALESDFEKLTTFIEQAPAQYFMYRDFQARNIMVHNDEPWFIDFQGGMKGPLQYDVASLLYQARAGLSPAMRTELLAYYQTQLQKTEPSAIENFEQLFYGFVCVRILQTLGAYGLRGLIEKKPHFLASIEPALHNAQEILQTIKPYLSLPELEKSIAHCLQSPIIKKMTEEKKMKVLVNSFSFKRGVPADHTGNGGGFVFDCRALPNPGKLDIYKPLTGMDIPVIEYLNSEPDVHEFIADAITMVDKSVSRYQQRGFTNLMVNFGCTGGRHRSVFCAEAMAKHLKESFDVQVELHHLEQEHR